MRKHIVFLLLLPMIWLIGCAGGVPPIEQDPNAVTLILKSGEKVEGRIVEIKDDLVHFEPANWAEYSRFNRYLRAADVKFVQLPNGTRFTLKDFVTYRWETKSTASKGPLATPIQANGIAKDGQKNVTTATGEDAQYEQLKKKAVAEMTPNEFRYFMMMKEREIGTQQQERVQPVEAVSAVAKTDSGKPAPFSFSVGPRVAPRISKDEEALKEIASLLVEAELAGPFFEAVRQKKEAGELMTLNQLGLVKAVYDMPEWRKRQDDLRALSAAAEQALAQVYLYAPDSLSLHLGLQFDANAEMDFRDLMEQLHRRFGDTVNMGDFRVLVSLFQPDAASAIREILNHYTDWRFAIENKHPLYSKKF